MQKKIHSIEIQKIMDYDNDLSYLGTFSDTAGKFAVENTQATSRNSYKYFNAENVEDMNQAKQNYEEIMKYDRGELYSIGIRAEADVRVSSDGKSWLINHVSSGGLWGIEQGYKGDEEDIQGIIDEQKDELKDVLLALGFSIDEIDAKIKEAEIVLK